MQYLYMYILFALTTGICALYELFSPVWSQIKQSHPKADVSRYGFVVGLVFLFASTITAPLTIFACIIPNLGDAFRKAFYTSMVGEGE